MYMKTVLMRVAVLCLAALFLPVMLFSTAAEDGSAPTKPPITSAFGVEEGSLSLACKSAILMDVTTGTVLYTQNAEEALPPASVTKVMTLLLVMEAIEAGTVRPENMVTVSANAASMGGSQVFLKEGEQMSVEEMLKCVIIASANDAAVALAEYLCGSVKVFVERMNERAAELGMDETHFENPTGLDDTAVNHLTSAHDIALMSRLLLQYPMVTKYSSLWMDTIRDGSFGLTNTNRLVRFYQGCTGLKTGSTSKAGFCVSAGAERDGLSLVCVIMGAANSNERNAAAAELLDWGFANYGLYQAPGGEYGPVKITGSTVGECKLHYADFSAVLPKKDLKNVTAVVECPTELAAPIRTGAELGRISYRVGEREIGNVGMINAEEIPKINFLEIFVRMAAKFLLI